MIQTDRQTDTLKRRYKLQLRNPPFVQIPCTLLCYCAPMMIMIVKSATPHQTCANQVHLPSI